MTGIVMYDSIAVDQIPMGPPAVAGYVGGTWANYGELVTRFPNAHHLSIAVNAGEDADCLDVETGDATPGDVPGWYDRQRAKGVERPCIYASASTMDSGIVPLVRAGHIARPLVRLWSAHYAGLHICAPSTCGAVSIDTDGTQWTSAAFARDLDESALLADFFGEPAPRPAPKPVTPAAVRHVTAGESSLSGLAAEHGCDESIILALTARNSGGGRFAADTAALIDGIFAGTIRPEGVMPAGLTLYLPA